MKLFIKCTVIGIFMIGVNSGTNDRPVIKTSSGDLTLQPAENKNIYLRPNGPNSGIYAGDINLLSINSSRILHDQSQTSNPDEVQRNQDTINALLQRVERLERKQNSPFGGRVSAGNWSTLVRRFRRLNNRVTQLEVYFNTDYCKNQPCLYGGTCLSVAGGYHCLCPSNWEGKNCDQDVNECRNFMGTDLGCQNGATCINRIGSYECLCRPGWYGVHCTRKLKDCSGGNFEMCGHGTCVPTTAGEGITCICEQGWTSNTTGGPCLTDIDECDPSAGSRCSTDPKVSCINLPGSFRCGPCPIGYEGDGYTCTDIDECLTNNGGCSTNPLVSCYNTVGSRICSTCPPGFDGDGKVCTWRGYCNINHGGCHPSAQCSDMGGFSLCICPVGMVGDGRGIGGCYYPNNTTGLASDCEGRCGAHGRCHLFRRRYICICEPGYGGANCLPIDVCSTRPCQNGGVCRLDQTNPNGYRCECTAQFSGDMCQIHAQSCGGVLNAEEGSIVYPLGNGTYNHNARCAWVIHTAVDKVINVTFSRFDIEVNPDCSYDFLQIHDGRSSASQLIGRFCGRSFPKAGNLISSHNTLYLWFRSDNSITRKGFALHWNSIAPVCGGDVEVTNFGRISSPGSPGPYPPNRDCYWHLHTTFMNRIQLHFYELDIQNHPNCSFDHLSIYDGEQDTAPLLRRYCTTEQPAPLTSSGSELLIHFHSDARNNGKGFQIAYTKVGGIPGCGGLYTSANGELSSPSYNGKYLGNLLCEYEIKVDPGMRVKLKFKIFEIEGSSGCSYDYLIVNDGPSSESPRVGKFCGNRLPPDYISSSNSIYIKFKSDHSISKKGFVISYESVCHQTVTGDSGIIKSPGYPLTYYANRVCTYEISVNPNKAIQLSFQDFDVEGNAGDTCSFDYVAVFDGANERSTSLGSFCGNHVPPTVTSTHNYMFVKFVSDISITSSGFYANFTTINTECGGIYKTAPGTINFPTDETERYQNDQNCNWVIEAEPGFIIKLTWNRFSLERFSNCAHGDYVEINEIFEDDSNSTLGMYCGTTLPPAFTTSTNKLSVRFVSDNSLNYNGFSLSYTFLNATSFCGGNYLSSSGVIRSPGWPDHYPSNRDCEWNITVPAGQRVSLNVSQFRLERPYGKRCDDYLEIRNGASNTAPLIGKFCDSNIPTRITAISNRLYLKFHSDFYIGATGFEIWWDGSVSGCGGTLTSPTGELTSPNYPNHYHTNAQCFYRIVASQGSKINITLLDVDLEQSFECSDDFIDIYDGRDGTANKLGRYCTTSDVTSITTTSNYAYIVFRSDFIFGGKGFSLKYETLCDNVLLRGSHGVIESPGYPDLHPGNIHCKWNIEVDKGNKINATFTDFNVESRRYLFRPIHDNPWPYSTSMLPGRSMLGGLTHYAPALTDCVDYVSLQDLTDTRKYCGVHSPPPFTTRSNTLNVTFESSGFHIRASSFRLEWKKHGCGGLIQKSFGNLVYTLTSQSNEEMQCEWIIETSFGTSATIIFSSVYLMDTTNCTTDSISVYAGQTTDYPLLSKFCHRISSPVQIQSSGNILLVKLSKTSSLRDASFSSRYQAMPPTCGGDLKTYSGAIYSKNYPKNYDNNLDCVWSITVPMNHRIDFKIIDFDLYYDEGYNEESQCGDQLRFYDTPYIIMKDSNYTKLICPDNNQTAYSDYYSRSNQMTVQFISDRIGTAKGFKAVYSVTCGAYIEANRDGIISNIDAVSHNQTNCTWTIVAPELDQKLSLMITYMSIPVMPEDGNVTTNDKCPSTYLRILDGIDVNAPLKVELCGRKSPPIMTSIGNALTIHFSSRSGIPRGKFKAHYSAVNTSCGGVLSSEQGSIASPNYPMSYLPNMDCEWTLQTSPGNQVYITFDTFDLENSNHCNEDYLEIRDTDGAGPLLALYCGSDIPINTTVSSKLYIRFHSDSEGSGRGFMLHYGFLHGNEITDRESGEITSPLYPHSYDGFGEYTWRVLVNSAQSIILDILRYEIPSYEVECESSLLVYDGYTADAPVLAQYCGMSNTATSLQSTSNAVFIKLKLEESNKGALFRLLWRQKDASLTDDGDVKTNCGQNTTELILPGQSTTFTSPNHPNNYGNNMNCEWTFKGTQGRHLSIVFTAFDIENLSECLQDYVSIYSSGLELVQWKPLAEKLCMETTVNQEFNATEALRVKFITDYSYTLSGFSAKVVSKCGGTITASTGIVKPFTEEYQRNIGLRCEWLVKVRPGRTMTISVDRGNITNANNCDNFLKLRNGESSESPLLYKFCGYSDETNDDIATTSNALFIEFNNIKWAGFQTFTLRFEESSIDCSGRSLLDAERKSVIITSPNYPNVPASYSECIWTFTGPPGEVLRVDFIERFDVGSTSDCTDEYVEIYDGMTQYSPLKGRFCKDNPGTVKSAGNMLSIKYVTSLADPRNGFKANVSIDVCGGTIYANNGELTSPYYPRGHLLPRDTLCVWRVIGNPKFTFKIKMDDFELPSPAAECGTKVTIEERTTDSDHVVETFCADQSYHDKPPVETISNEFFVKMRIGELSKWRTLRGERGFRLTFNSSTSVCGGDITTPEGYIATPGYPRVSNTRYCHWTITSPDPNNKIKLEFSDSPNLTPSGGHVMLYNDLRSISELASLSGTSLANRVFESTSNTMIIVAWTTSSVVLNFKARFTAYEPVSCGGQLESDTGEIVSPSLNSSYFCRWKFNTDIVNPDNQYKTVYIHGNIVSQNTKHRCRYRRNEGIIMKSILSDGIPLFVSVCTGTGIDLRMPLSNLEMQSIKKLNSTFSFNLQYSMSPCGGQILVGDDPVDIVDLPAYNNSSLECIWVVHQKTYWKRMELTLEGTFSQNCEDEYFKITDSLLDSAHVIGDYCRDRMPQIPLNVGSRFIFVQYHSRGNHSGIKLSVKRVTASHECGRLLTYYDTTFSSPHYPKAYDSNEECIWEVQSDSGTYVTLKFTQRFAIEYTENCTKDSVTIYDWKDDKYTEIAKLCGRTLPSVFNSTSNKMKIVLRTDNENNLDGFRATWLPICDTVMIATATEQYLYSPPYTLLHRTSNCIYNIRTPDDGQKVILQFISFTFKSPCEKLNMTVSGTINYLSSADVYCEDNAPPPSKIYSNGVTLKYTNDNFRQGRFKIAFSIYNCGGTVTHPKIISTAKVNEKYGNDENCTWSIQAPNDKVIIIDFQYIDIENTYDCLADYVAVYNGSLIDPDKRLACLCGQDRTGTIIRTGSSNALLQFYSDFDLSYRGFKAEITFSYSESVGCGGFLNLTNSATLKSPFINGSTVYEPFLDCTWNIWVPEGKVIKLEFTSFHIAPCIGANQTALGSVCNCDKVVISDGIYSDSYVIGTFCGHTLPQGVTSSRNRMEVRLVTNGDVESSGFEATLTAVDSPCGQTVFTVPKEGRIKLKSPGFDSGTVPAGLNCIYQFRDFKAKAIHINTIDLSEPSSNVCDKDRVIIQRIPHNNGFSPSRSFVSSGYSFNSILNYCGSKQSIDLYNYDEFNIVLITSPDSTHHKGVDIDVIDADTCPQNRTGLQGRIIKNIRDDHDCFTTITAPENYTISLYFNTFYTIFHSNDESQIEIFDGNTLSSNRLVGTSDTITSVFSTGRYLLLHSRRAIQFDLIFIATDKGRGCGGKFHNKNGKITSPLYPDVYRKVASCEWELETTVGYRLELHFEVFDLGAACDTNYVQLVDREGQVYSTYCSHEPATYRSQDNYVKVVFKTDMNNGGTGWVANYSPVKTNEW